MSLRRGRQRAELMGDINVVSLIDVMMLLLVIFMITAPIMQGGVEVNLPTADASPVDPDKSGLVVTVTADSVYIDKTAYSTRTFERSFKSLAGPRAKNGIFLASDKRVDVQRFLDVMGVINRAGVGAISIMTQPPDDAGR